jgi:hypothetical protein
MQIGMEEHCYMKLGKNVVAITSAIKYVAEKCQLFFG